MRARRSTPTDDEMLHRMLRETMQSPDLEEHALHRMETEQAVRRLHRVAPEQARAVVLAVFGGCTAAQVGQQEGIPLGTAKTRIRTGLRRLRESMEVEHD